MIPRRVCPECCWPIDCRPTRCFRRLDADQQPGCVQTQLGPRQPSGHGNLPDLSRCRKAAAVRGARPTTCKSIAANSVPVKGTPMATASTKAAPSTGSALRKRPIFAVAPADSIELSWLRGRFPRGRRFPCVGFHGRACRPSGSAAGHWLSPLTDCSGATAVDTVAGLRPGLPTISEPKEEEP